jgi:hypothetical protein
MNKTAIPTIAPDQPSGAYCEEILLYARSLMVRDRLADAGNLYPVGPTGDLYCARLILANLRAWRKTLPKDERGRQAVSLEDSSNRDLIGYIIGSAVDADRGGGGTGRLLRLAEADARALITRYEAAEAARRTATAEARSRVGVRLPVPSAARITILPEDAPNE